MVSFWDRHGGIIDHPHDLQLQSLFAILASTGREDSAQLCVYVGGEKVLAPENIYIETRSLNTMTESYKGFTYSFTFQVVDLWGSRSQASYTADTLTNVFSRFQFPN